MATKLDHALSLAELGFRVFPLIPNSKKPLFTKWTESATADRGTITSHWSKHPNANIAILTGEGLLVLDEDNKDGKQGADSLFALQLEHGDIPDTLASVTPTGGRHYLLRSQVDIHNSVSRIGKDLDVRGWHGFIVAPGSTIDGGEYAWETFPTHAIAQAPAWLEELTLRANPRLIRQSDTPITDLDHPQAISRASDYLRSTQPAIQGDHGDLTTLKTAMHLKDFGLSEGAAIDLMLDVYNARCEPPWHPDEMLIKVGNAYRYGKNQPGIADPVADFGITVAEETQQAPKPMLTSNEIYSLDVADYPPRRFVLGDILCRGTLTVLVAPPGAGKTTLMMNMLLSVASGRPEPCGLPVRERCPVWYFNNEDDQQELNRRLVAAMTLFNIGWQDVTAKSKAYIHLNSGYDQPLLLAKRGGTDNKKVVSQPEVDQIIAIVKDKGIGLLILDPLIELHQSDENDNVQMDQVARVARRIASEGACSVVLVHHTRKQPAGSSEGFAGNMDSGRGAGALNGKARAVLTLYGLSDKDAQRYGLSDDERMNYIRLDGGKNNLGLISSKPQIFERVSVPIGGLDGEKVGALRPVCLSEPAASAAGQAAVARDVLSVMEPEIEKRVLVKHIIARLMDANPLYRSQQNAAVAQRLKRSLALPVDTDGWRVVCAKGEGDTAHWSIVVEAVEVENDDNNSVG